MAYFRDGIRRDLVPPERSEGEHYHCDSSLKSLCYNSCEFIFFLKLYSNYLSGTNISNIVNRSYYWHVQLWIASLEVEVYNTCIE